MYENLTYDEIKKLPKDQKIAAWGELITLFPDKKALAKKLGVRPVLLNSMISRYINIETTGYPDIKTLEAVRRKKRQRNMNPIPDNSQKTSNDISSIELNTCVNINNDDSNIFSISLKKTLSGENAQCILSGIANSLIKNQNYVIEVKIIEKL